MRSIYIVLFVLVLGFFQSSSAQQIVFTENAIEWALNYYFEETPVTTGSGISLVDFNGDGQDDLSFGTHSSVAPKFYLSDGSQLTLANNSGFIFETNGSRSLIWVDFDNDGDKDLSISNVNSNPNSALSGTPKLFEQTAPGVFEDVTFDMGWSIDPIQSYSQSWADINNDGWLDCYIGNRTGANLLYMSVDGESFNEVASSAGVQDQFGLTYQSLLFDIDMDGDIDTYNVSDKSYSRNSLFRTMET